MKILCGELLIEDKNEKDKLNPNRRKKSIR